MAPHHHHHSHSHQHEHAPARRASVVPASLLLASAPQRLAGAAVLTVLLWAAVFWAMA